jgi:hypothetical protein
MFCSESVVNWWSVGGNHGGTGGQSAVGRVLVRKKIIMYVFCLFCVGTDLELCGTHLFFFIVLLRRRLMFGRFPRGMTLV